MGAEWPPLDYADWSDTCDTLHAHTQVLGKLVAAYPDFFNFCRKCFRNLPTFGATTNWQYG